MTGFEVASLLLAAAGTATGIATAVNAGRDPREAPPPPEPPTEPLQIGDADLSQQARWRAIANRRRVSAASLTIDGGNNSGGGLSIPKY